MRPMWIASVLMFGIGIGCVTATVAQNLVAAPARAGTDPTRWETMCIDAESAEVKAVYLSDFQDPSGWGPALSRRGTEGWEPMQFIAEAESMIRGVCLKRPLP